MPPAEANPQVELADRLHSTAIHLLRRVAREDAVSGLGGPALSALSVVVFAGPITLGRLAEAERVRPPTMTRTVHGLEAAGLVRRAPDPDDGRVVNVRATRRGESVLHAARARRVAALASGLRALSEHELVVLEHAVGLLERLVTT
jgi:DNA-binding MarR family transcriptional regulator